LSGKDTTRKKSKPSIRRKGNPERKASSRKNAAGRSQGRKRGTLTSRRVSMLLVEKQLSLREYLGTDTMGENGVHGVVQSTGEQEVLV